MVCISVSPVPPDFEIATKRVVVSGSCASMPSNVAGSRLSRKWMRGCRAGADAGHGVARELRQRLAAEARAAGAEEDHVGRAVAQQRRVAEDGGDVVALLRQPQQRQRAVGVACAQELPKRLAGAGQHVRESAGRA